MATTEMTLAEYAATRKSKRDELRKARTFWDTEETLREGLAGMFTRTYSEPVDGADRAEQWLSEDGAICYVIPSPEKIASIKYKDMSRVRCCHVSFGGVPYPNGIGRIAFASGDGDGYLEEFEDWMTNDKIVVAFNNLTKTPDLNILRTSDKLMEIDTSLRFQLFFSRLKPIPLVHDDKTKLAIDKALKDIDNGKIETILSDNLLSKMTGDSSAAVELLELTRPEAAQYIQYLSHYRDDVLRNFWSLYGMDAKGASKMAQQTVGEVNEGDKLGQVLPENMLHCRKEEAEALSEKFSITLTVDFSEPWKLQKADVIQEAGESDEETEETEQEGEEDNEDMGQDDSGGA